MSPDILPTYMLVSQLSRDAHEGAVYVCYIQAHTMGARC